MQPQDHMRYDNVSSFSNYLNYEAIFFFLKINFIGFTFKLTAAHHMLYGTIFE